MTPMNMMLGAQGELFSAGKVAGLVNAGGTTYGAPVAGSLNIAGPGGQLGLFQAHGLAGATPGTVAAKINWEALKAQPKYVPPVHVVPQKITRTPLLARLTGGGAAGKAAGSAEAAKKVGIMTKIIGKKNLSLLARSMRLATAAGITLTAAYFLLSNAKSVDHPFNEGIPLTNRGYSP